MRWAARSKACDKTRRKIRIVIPCVKCLGLHSIIVLSGVPELFAFSPCVLHCMTAVFSLRFSGHLL